MFGDGREKTVFAGFKKGALGGGTWCDDADDFAAHQFFAQAGLLHLIADGDFEAGADQACDVAFGSVIGNATHGDGVSPFFVARGERDLQLARGDHRVFIEEFVEITEAEEQ